MASNITDSALSDETGLADGDSDMTAGEESNTAIIGSTAGSTVVREISRPLGGYRFGQGSAAGAIRSGVAIQSFPELSASEIRRVLQRVFPQRRLVLSQFTFFNQIGIARPSGSTFKRGRRCYRLQDLLSIATVLALKEEGIPFKNVEALPNLVQQNADKIFSMGSGCRLTGFGDTLSLQLPGGTGPIAAIEQMLADPAPSKLLWSYDLGKLAEMLVQAATEPDVREIEIVAA